MRLAVCIFVCGLLAASAHAGGQAAGRGPEVALASAETGRACVQDGGSVFRERYDPSTGARWLLEQDRFRPGGPGCWVSVAAGNRESSTVATRTSASRPGNASGCETVVIRAGDSIVVEEHSPIVDARLEAVALGSAVAGGTCRARLRIGGKVLVVVALGPGHAVFDAKKRTSQ